MGCSDIPYTNDIPLSIHFYASPRNYFHLPESNLIFYKRQPR